MNWPYRLIWKKSTSETKQGVSVKSKLKAGMGGLKSKDISKFRVLGGEEVGTPKYGVLNFV